MSKYYIASTVFLIALLGSLALDGTLVVPRMWYASLAALFVSITAYGTIVLRTSFFVPVQWRGSGNRIALTFDDGPLPGMTDRILSILAEHNVKATFFCIGHRMEKNPFLIKQMENEGHLLGNHTYWHGAFFNFKSASMVTRELMLTDLACFSILGRRMRLFRPPYGVTNPMIAKALKRTNHTVVGWSVRSFDTITRDPEKLFRRVTAQLKPGDIILFHDYCESTITILPRLIRHITNKGYDLVRVDELLNIKGYAGKEHDGA
jgi:peptidoglycan-N-acetylglucosamine deacetylase